MMLDAMIKSTVLLLLVGIACLLLRRRSAALRHLLWTMGIVGMIALPALTVWSPFRLHLLPAPTARASVASDDVRAPAREATVADEEPVATLAAEDAPPVAATPAPARSLLSVGNVLVAGWLAGALLLLAKFLAGLIVVRRIARRGREVTDESWCALADGAARALGVTGPVEMRTSGEVEMPFACGLAHPVIVIPASASEWTPEHRRTVLTHELAHVSRGDLAMNAFAHLTRALYWFHPLAWLAVHRLRVESERACDDEVLRAGARPSDYAEHLLTTVQSMGPAVPTAALAMARRSEFEGRLLAILEPGIPRARLGALRVAAAAASFAVVVLTLAALAPARVSAMPALQSTEKAAEREQEAAAPSSTVGALIETLDDASVAVRLAAVGSLAQLQDPRAIAALSKAMREDTDARVRAAAAEALGQIDHPRAVPALLEALKAERVANVREKIVHALAEIDDPSAVAGISAAVRDPSVKVRREVAHALGELDDPDAVPALLTMARDEDAEVREQVANALGELESSSAVETLMALARDPVVDVRAQAINALGDLHDRRALAVLVAALKDASAEVRSQAANAVHNLEDIKQAPAGLIEALADPDREVRKSVAEALGQIEDPAAVPALKRAIADSDREVRHAVAEALSSIGGADAVQALLGLLKDPDPEIRRIAAEALGSKRR